MVRNVPSVERTPRVVVALAAGVGAALARSATVKTMLFGLAGGLLTTVAIEYCPLNALRDRRGPPPSRWRTLRSWRVETTS